PTIVGRTHVPVLGEYPGEYLVRRVSDLLSDLCDRKVRPFKEFAGPLHSQSRQVYPWRHADTMLEHAREMKRREPRLGCKFVEADVFGKPRMQQFKTAPLCPWGKAALCRRERRPAQAAQFGQYLVACGSCQQPRRRTLFVTQGPQVPEH